MTYDARELLLANPDLFIAHYFRDAIDQLEPFHLELIRAATEEPRALVLFPAGHGKTTIVSTLIPIYEMCKDPNIRISVIGKNEDEAKNKIARAIIAELMGNDRLIEDFGPFKDEERESKPWSLGSLSISSRTIRAKEPTLSFFGSGSKGTLGHRADHVICDDVVTAQNSATPEQRSKMREWFNQTVRTMGRLPNSRLSVVGTVFHPEDLYHDLMDLRNPETGEPIYQKLHKDAILDEDNKQTLWPERWSWDRLMELKAEIGTLDFNKRLRNRAVDPSQMVFREEYVKGGWIGQHRYPGCLDRKFCVGDFDPSWRVYCGFDPAIGSYRDAKFCAHMTIAVGSCAEHERCYWVLDLIRDQMPLPRQVDLIIEQHDRYKAFSSQIEANAYQAGLLEEVRRRLKEDGRALKIEPHYTTRTNKPDPELGVHAMSPLFESGLVHIPWANPAATRKMQAFVDELLQYPSGRTTDTVMAFWFAWRATERQAPRFKTVNRLKANPLLQNRPKRVLKNPYYSEV